MYNVKIDIFDLRGPNIELVTLAYVKTEISPEYLVDTPENNK